MTTGDLFFPYKIDARAKAILFPLGVDADDNLWVAHVGGRRVAKLSAAGDELDSSPCSVGNQCRLRWS